jgi:two-component system LytT family response regulator
MNPTAPLRVIIVEDLIAIQQDIQYLLRHQPAFIVVGTCGSVHDAVVLIHNTKPDLLLLDIGLPDGTGFDILEQLPAQLKVIFLTAHEEYAIRAIRYGAIDYLLKPIDEKEFAEALQRAVSAQPLLQDQIDITVQNYRNKTQHYIALQVQDVVRIVKLKDIRYLQGDNGNTIFFLNDGKKIVSTKNVKDYEELLSGTSFLRPHQSYLVNEIFIDRYHPKECLLYLEDGTRIPVSLRKKGSIDQHFKTL